MISSPLACRLLPTPTDFIYFIATEITIILLSSAECTPRRHEVSRAYDMWGAAGAYA